MHTHIPTCLTHSPTYAPLSPAESDGVMEFLFCYEGKHNLQTHTHTHKHKHTCACIHTPNPNPTHTHTRTQTYTYTYTHTRIHTHIHISSTHPPAYVPLPLANPSPLMTTRHCTPLPLSTIITALDAGWRDRVNLRGYERPSPNHAGAAEKRRWHRSEKLGDAAGRCRGAG